MVKGCRWNRRFYAGIIFVCALSALMLFSVLPAKAQEVSLRLLAIDYNAEELTLETNGDTRIYVSNKSMKTWDEVFGEWSTDGKTFTMDISWISKSSNYVLTIRGNVSENPVMVTIPKMVTNFKAKIDFLTNRPVYTNADGRAIEWRKKNSTAWHTTGSSEAELQALMNDLESFYAKGTTLYFRLAAENGTVTANGFDPGKRISKEAGLAIAKRANGPVVVLNTAKESVTSVKSTMIYRKQGDASWREIPSGSTSVLLAEAAPELFAAYDGDGLVVTTGQSVNLEFKTKGTASKMESKIYTVPVPGQEDAPQNVEFEFTSPTTLLITAPDVTDADGRVIIPKASTKNPYEYTILAENATGPAIGALWQPITSSLGATVKSSAAPEGKVLCVRKKAYSDAAVKRLASAYMLYEVEEYPATSVIEENPDVSDPSVIKDPDTGVLHLTKMGGVPDASNLSFVITMAQGMETDVKQITCSNTMIPFSSTVSGREITVTVISTDKVEAATSTRGEALPVTITLKNGEVITGKVDLTLTQEPKLTASAPFVLMRGETPAGEYAFTVIPGVDTAGDAAQVESVSCAGIKLDFTSEALQDGKIKVIMDNDSLPGLYTAVTKAGIAQKAVITFDNGAVISSGVTFMITSPAKYVNTQEFELNKRVGVDLNETMTLQMTLADSSLEIASVTWRGHDIKGNASKSGSSLFVELDNNRLNALNLQSGENSHREYILVKFTNGTYLQECYSILLTK